MKVRDMPRRQQKAVFAHLIEDKGYFSALEGAEKYQRKRNYLIAKKDLEETYEDKAFTVWEDSKLTYKQKLGKIAQLHKDFREDLEKEQKKESAPTITGQIKEHRAKLWKEQEKKPEITEEKGNPVPVISAEKPHLTERYARYRIREPEDFVAGSFRVHDIGREGHSKRIAGKLKSTGKWETQAILISRKDYEKGSYLQKKDGRLEIIHLGKKPEDAEKKSGGFTKQASPVRFELSKERKEHPTLPEKTIKQIVADHAQKNA